MAVYTAEPVADVLAVAFTTVLFIFVFRKAMKKLEEKKGVIFCGDLNVAHQEIDLKNPKSNRGSAGFSDEERSCFTQLLASGFTDTFRHHGQSFLIILRFKCEFHRPSSSYFP